MARTVRAAAVLKAGRRREEANNLIVLEAGQEEREHEAAVNEIGRRRVEV